MSRLTRSSPSKKAQESCRVDSPRSRANEERFVSHRSSVVGHRPSAVDLPFSVVISGAPSSSFSFFGKGRVGLFNFHQQTINHSDRRPKAEDCFSMNTPRRHFLGSSLIVLGSTLMDALTTPLWKWKSSAVLQATAAAPAAASPVTFVDVAREAGLNAANVWGAADHKRYIIEAKGSGLAFFDYDHDGWLDIYLTNGTHLDANWPPGKAPNSHLYKNNRDGTFTDVTEKSSLGRTGWQTGVCVGDYNNDGWDDLFCCFWGHTILFHNNGDGTFTDVTRKAGVYDERVRWGCGCTFLDYDRDGYLDLFVSNYIHLDPEKTGAPGESATCQWKGIPVMCGPRGLTGDTNVLYHNNGD